MKEHPILFSAPMVRAILEDRKAQTRRIVACRNSLFDGVGCSQVFWDRRALNFDAAWVDQGPSPAGNPGPYLKVPGDDDSVRRIYPRLWTGDRLWVRETWNTSANVQPPISAPYIYAADLNSSGVMRWAVMRWRPSIHMPRAASRITLEVTGVRVERLTGISRDDAIAEGLSFVGDADACWGVPGDAASWWGDPRRSFQQLWTSINGAPAWFANPWVWVLEFRRCS